MATTRGRSKAPLILSQRALRHHWIAAQRLDSAEPFGSGPDAVAAVVAQLGYVQIDTINVIERCHHHILYNRIPTYRRSDLGAAQTVDRTVFEYWTHALSFVPVADMRFYSGTMKAHAKDPAGWGGVVTPRELSKILKRIRDEGALAISDIKDDTLVEKAHLWASKKPSKRALEAGFYSGRLVISKRDGMLKTYELAERHFGWERLPKPATKAQIDRYHIDRAIRAQGVVSLDSICFNATYSKPPVDKPAIAELIEKDVRAKRLIELRCEGDGKTRYFARPETLDAPPIKPALTHILSPFDPLIIQRRRTESIFDYAHVFEAYVAKDKRRFGYFTLPVLHGDEIVAALDLKAERRSRQLLVQAWHWVGRGNDAEHKAAIEAELDRFAAFQFADMD